MDTIHGLVRSCRAVPLSDDVIACTGHSDNSNDANKQCRAFWDWPDRAGVIKPCARNSSSSTARRRPQRCPDLGPAQEHAAETVCEGSCRPESCSGNSAEEPDVWGSRVGVPAFGIVSDTHHIEKCTAGMLRMHDCKMYCYCVGCQSILDIHLCQKVQ